MKETTPAAAGPLPRLEAEPIRNNARIFVERPDGEPIMFIAFDGGTEAIEVAARIAAACNAHEAMVGIAEGVLTCLKYPRGSEAQVRCLEEVGQDARYHLAKGGAS